ncbi:MAG: tetratricopeptide repeat protein [Deltaproteobacteria bacterium]|nr:tetratricopeptide repeat protein [Deltaproteobacteria bacterium]
MYLTVRLIFKNNPRSEEIAILSAIIFGVHPIAVESVAWICGRTDPLATMWGLLAFWLYLSARLKNRWYLLPFSLFCILASALSKEVGVAIPIIIAVWETAYSRIYWNVTMGKKKIIFIVSTAIIPAYILLRLIFLDAKDMSLGLIKGGISSDIPSSTLAFLASFGFYIKKFIYPFPLELVIEDINIPIYAFFGFAVIMFLVISICINSLRKYSFFLLWALLGIGPAALISFTDIAWTRWAERYLYFSLVPLSVMTSMAYFEVTDRLSYEKKRVASIVGIGLLVSLALATYHRSRLWNDNLSFWTDAYNKSPDSINVSVTYSRSLIESKMETEAEKVLYKALDLNGPKHQVVYDLANISRSRGDFEKAEEYYNEALSEAKSDKRFILEGARFKSRILLSMGELKIGQAVKIDDNEQKKVLHLKGIDFMDQAYLNNT